MSSDTCLYCVTTTATVVTAGVPSCSFAVSPSPHPCPLAATGQLSVVVLHFFVEEGSDFFNSAWLFEIHLYCAFLFSFVAAQYPLVGFPGGSAAKNPPAVQESRRHGFDPWVGKILQRRAWEPTPAFLPGEAHGQRSRQAIVCRVAKSRTWLKWVSTHARSRVWLY